ncbi:MAG TPA: tetratricopeptide repeat protein [Candidatus Polarisedimenticolia bacterium]|nr:tetratricopeptide repeat protein [Candidatus Polarisedimenticolia bacterium]
MLRSLATLVLLLLPFPVLLDAAPRRASARAEVAFTYGVAAWQRGDHREALARFEEAVKADPGDGTARHWLGMTRLKLGDARGAAADLQGALDAERPPEDRARALADLAAARLEAGDAAGAEAAAAASLEARPGDPRAMYLHGMALAALGRAGEGRAEAERARAADSGLPELPGAIAPGTGEVVPSQRLPRAEIRIGLEYGPDSNPSGLPDHVTGVFDPNNPSLRLDGGDQVALGTLRGEVHPFYDKAGWSLGLRLDAVQSLHDDMELFDQGQGGVVAQLAWGKDPLGFVTGPMGYTRVPAGSTRASFLFQAGSSYGELDGESYQRVHQGAASVTLREGNRTATQIDFDYRDLSYFQNPVFTFDIRALSGHEGTLRASQYLYLQRRDRYVRVSAARGESRRELEGFNASSFTGGLEAAFPLPANLSFFVSALWREDRFDDLPGGEAHEHETITVLPALIWVFSDHFYLTARGGWIERNVDNEQAALLFEYDRRFASLGVTWYH